MNINKQLSEITADPAVASLCNDPERYTKIATFLNGNGRYLLASDSDGNLQVLDAIIPKRRYDAKKIYPFFLVKLARLELDAKIAEREGNL